ncbi:MAG TPA: tetratricopeptide repeat protein, partial [Gammaproteobacteria bacterium]|nr:tetratricopeptide repeat protein [Gammaproteobacteria bacterium]
MKMRRLCRKEGVTVKGVTRLLFVLVSIAMHAGAYALGLGEIKLRSALEEPFDAEIELSSASDSVLKSLQVKLAGPEDFARVGIKPVPAINLLKFDVVKKPGGGAAIHITTQEPIHDPYLNFLVEANWGSGRALREYTVLLDPPELAGEDAPIIEAPVVEAAQPEPVVEPEVPTAEIPPVAAVTPESEPPAISEEQVIDETVAEPELPPVDDEELIEPEVIEPEPLPEVAEAGTAESELPPVDEEGLMEPEIIEPEPLPEVAEAEPELPAVDEEGLLDEAPAETGSELPLAETEAVQPEEPGQQAALDLDDVTVGSETEAETAPLSYEVQRGDTLWSIAERMRGDRSASVYQVMMALFHNNRHAFFGDNVNNLKAGTVLRIEDEGELTAVSSVAAKSEFWQQYRAWQDYKQMLAENVVTQTDTLPEAGPDVVLSDKTYTAEEVADLPEATKAVQEKVLAEEQGGAQLKLVSPEEMAPATPAQEGDATAGTATEEGAGSASLAELQKMREEVVAEIEKSEQGSSQNQALREKLAALEEQIANLQRVVSVKDTELAAMQQKAAERVQEPVVETETPPVEESGLMARLNRSPQLMGILGGAILLLLAWLWLMFRRRKGEGAPEPAAAVEVDDFSDESGMEEYYAEQVAEEGSLLARIDTLTEQGNHAEAVELLNDAIQKEPENEDYRYRLLEILHEMKNKDAFAHEAEELYGLSGGRDKARWGKIVAMGAALLPAHPLFASGDSDAADISDIDQFLSGEEDAAAGEWDDVGLEE